MTYNNGVPRIYILFHAGRGMRRRLTLAPLRSPSRASLESGSRFSCLVRDADSDDGGSSLVAEAVAWQGLEDDPLVPQLELRPKMTEEELVAEFWGKIGYPTPASRSWERAASPVSSPKVRTGSCRDSSRARSASPAQAEKIKEGRGASPSSPVGLSLTRPPRTGARRGPLPRRRITSLPMFGDFFVKDGVESGWGLVPGRWKLQGPCRSPRRSPLQRQVRR
jgi:hypothetical protein